jgi:hypothetical protein
MAIASIILLGEVGSSVLVLLNGALEVVTIKLFLTMSAFPLFCAVVGARVLRKVQRSLRDLPERLFEKLSQAMRLSIRLNVVLALIGPMVTFALANPSVYIAFALVNTPLELWHSFVKVTAFKPIGVAVPTGPIGAIVDAVGRALAKVVAAITSKQIKPTGAVTVAAASAASERRSSAPDLETGLPGYLLLGVSLAFLREFIDEHQIGADRSTVEVAAVARELSKVSAESICELQRGRLTKAGEPAVGRATVFMSHAQRCKFTKLCDAIEHYLSLHRLDPASTRIWIDAFSIRQHRVESDVMHIQAIEKAIGRVCMILDPWDSPICLTRGGRCVGARPCRGLPLARALHSRVAHPRRAPLPRPRSVVPRGGNRLPPAPDPVRPLPRALRARRLHEGAAQEPRGREAEAHGFRRRARGGERVRRSGDDHGERTARVRLGGQGPDGRVQRAPLEHHREGLVGFLVAHLMAAGTEVAQDMVA